MRIRFVLWKLLILQRGSAGFSEGFFHASGTWTRVTHIMCFGGMPEERIYYMPVWTVEEMREIANVTQPTDDWESVYQIMGGIPRIVFESWFSEDRAIGALEHAASKFDLNIISSLVGVYENGRGRRRS